MRAATLEAFLARLYCDAAFRRDFVAHPARVAAEAGLDEAQTAAMLAVDRSDLEAAADSYRHKREGRPASRGGWLRKLLARWR